ncbi:MAG: hypothetical protein CMJ62_18515 [Planctomycetaceae bacterium]|nr:hypothetical protein [Planctomycetaceae bacterium]
MPNRQNQLASFDITRQHGWSGIASFQQSGATIQTQTSLDFRRCGRMAFVAITDQYRPDFPLEKFDLLLLRGSGKRVDH